MIITKNNEIIEVAEEITSIILNSDDIVNISANVESFDSKLAYGTLILSNNSQEIHINNVTNVLNTSNAKIEFQNKIINSMDELFNVVKDNLGPEFKIDIQEVMYEDEDEENFIYDIIEEKSIVNNPTKETHKNRLLIIVSNNNIESIINFPIMYANQEINKNNWQEINIIFIGQTTNLLRDNRLKEKLKESIDNGVNIYYFCEDGSNNIDTGIVKLENTQMITNALKSNVWSVLTV